MTVLELKQELSRGLDLSDEALEKRFRFLAKSLFSSFQIKKGGNRYWFSDIEFYLYNDRHRDIVTYPRNCPAGSWFLHSSGVDLSFGSKVSFRVNPKSGRCLPYLESSSVFGGILIRGIVPATHNNMSGGILPQKLDGPYKVSDFLFDHFDAFGAPKDFPKIVECVPREVQIETMARHGLSPDSEKKVLTSILPYNYSGCDIPEIDLIEGYEKYLSAQYRFRVLKTKMQ